MILIRQAVILNLLMFGPISHPCEHHTFSIISSACVCYHVSFLYAPTTSPHYLPLWSALHISLDALVGKRKPCPIVERDHRTNKLSARIPVAIIGGTEVRDLFHPRLSHGMRAWQAQLLSLTQK